MSKAKKTLQNRNFAKNITDKTLQNHNFAKNIRDITLQNRNLTLREAAFAMSKTSQTLQITQ